MFIYSSSTQILPSRSDLLLSQTWHSTAKSDSIVPDTRGTAMRTTNLHDGVHRQVEFEKIGNWVIKWLSLLLKPGRDPDGGLYYLFISTFLFFNYCKYLNNSAWAAEITYNLSLSSKTAIKGTIESDIAVINEVNAVSTMGFIRKNPKC